MHPGWQIALGKSIKYKTTIVLVWIFLKSVKDTACMRCSLLMFTHLLMQRMWNFDYFVIPVQNNKLPSHINYNERKSSQYHNPCNWKGPQAIPLFMNFQYWIPKTWVWLLEQFYQCNLRSHHPKEIIYPRDRNTGSW